MSGTKRKGSDEVPDLSHHPTRKVDSMSALVAEMLLRDPDADATSPGLPPVDAGAVLLAVRSSVAPVRARKPRVVVVIVVLCVVVGIVAAALALALSL